MTDHLPKKPPRRPRYRGKNPRGFAEKYKERQPDRYPDEAAKVLAGGKTPAGTHRPIMVREIVDVLGPRPGEIAVDCTLGHGGHARALLAAVQPGGRLIAIDADPIEGPKAEARLVALGYPAESLVVRQANYADLAAVLEANGGAADVILADLGLSSMQIDDPARGFGFKTDGPLDMRMNPSAGEPASALLSRLDKHRLAGLLEANADEPEAEGLALAILSAHRKAPITTTGRLATTIHAAYPRLSTGSADDAVRRAFQALRIEVNGEFTALDALLRDLPRCLKAGGRVAILSFHSGEDRRVKAAFKAGLRDGTYASIARDVTRASLEEQRDNPRSSSAKLRYATTASPDPRGVSAVLGRESKLHR